MSRYKVYVTPAAWKEIKNLPGRMRQRVRKAIESLAEKPPSCQEPSARCAWPPMRGAQAQVGPLADGDAITEADEAVDVLAVRKRPPYDYGDLESLLHDYPSG